MEKCSEGAADQKRETREDNLEKKEMDAQVISGVTREGWRVKGDWVEIFHVVCMGHENCKVWNVDT